jgi:probable rRNA maturation factor
MDTSPGALSIDIAVKSPLWEAQPEAEQVVCRALGAAASLLSTRDAELAIVLTDDSAIRALNREWRGIDQSTNVLSFPAKPVGSALPVFLGDIVIAFETTMGEARSESKRFEHHLAHLAVHGFLHLLGQDHDNDRDAEAMEGLERTILACLGISDPYAAGDLVPTAEYHA